MLEYITVDSRGLSEERRMLAIFTAFVMFSVVRLSGLEVRIWVLEANSIFSVKDAPETLNENKNVS